MFYKRKKKIDGKKLLAYPVDSVERKFESNYFPWSKVLLESKSNSNSAFLVFRAELLIASYFSHNRVRFVLKISVKTSLRVNSAYEKQGKRENNVYVYLCLRFLCLLCTAACKIKAITFAHNKHRSPTSSCFSYSKIIKQPDNCFRSRTILFKKLQYYDFSPYYLTIRKYEENTKQN